MTAKTAIIVAGNSGAEIAARVAATIGDERHTSIILDMSGPGVPPEIPGVAVMPELGMPYGAPGSQFPAGVDPYEAFAEYARGDADLDRRMRMIDDPQMPVEAIVGDEVPDRVSIERPSAHYDPCVDNLGVRIDGIEQDSVVEYCVSGGWARIGERDHRGKLIWEFDHYRARRVDGVKVEPYWRRALSRQQRRARAAKARKAR